MSFGAPKKPKIAPVPQAPAPDPQAQDEATITRLRDRRGYAASILTGEGGLGGNVGNIGKKALLGG